MELPKLTPLQFLVVHLLFVGQQSGSDLRKAMAALGVRRSAATFCRLMGRMECLGYVEAEYHTQAIGGVVIRQRRFAVTDFGVMTWERTQKFYANLPPPSPDLVPVATEQGELDAYDPKTRQRIIRKRLAKEFPGLFRWRRRAK